MARPRKSALDSVLAEIQETGQPSLQEMLKAKAAEEASKEELAEEDLTEPPLTEEEALKRLGFEGIDMGEVPEDADTTSLMTDEEKEEARDAIREALCQGEPVEEMVCEPPVPDIVEKEVAVVTEPVKAVTIEEQYQELKLTPREKDMVLDGRLKEILGVPKARAAVPTLVRYRQDGQLALRGVIIDIGEYELTEGWKLYKSQVNGATPEKYLLKVYELTQTEIPRMYRTVGEMRLE